mmetsp:Transcript_44715/g.127621  ORF Transcript_44715/g.127621 Transcript_44715/m.127621 type:complete len:205 (+) Transcript_44715:414-1028(+)
MISSIGLSSGATSASTSSVHLKLGFVLSASSSQNTFSWALMNSSMDRFLKTSWCLSFRAWMMGCAPSSDMRMPLEFVRRMVLAIPSMISFFTSSFSFLPAAIASSSAFFAAFLASGSNALPFLSVERLKSEFINAAFWTWAAFWSRSFLSASSLPPLGAPTALLWRDFMYFWTTLLLFLFLRPNVLSSAIFSFCCCLALSFGGI